MKEQPDNDSVVIEMCIALKNIRMRLWVFYSSVPNCAAVSMERHNRSVQFECYRATRVLGKVKMRLFHLILMV